MDASDFQGLNNDRTINSIKLKQLSLSTKHRTARAMHACRKTESLFYLHHKLRFGNNHQPLLQIFNGNNGRNDIVKHNLVEIAIARFVRFQPIEFRSGKALRVELYGLLKSIGKVTHS